MTVTAAVFISGNCQAVRIPKEFEFQANRVHIERRGDEIVLWEVALPTADNLTALADPLPKIKKNPRPSRARRPKPEL